MVLGILLLVLTLASSGDRVQGSSEENGKEMQSFQNGNREIVKRAQTWLLAQRRGGNWGEETPRALVALVLSRDSPGTNSTADLEFQVLEREFKLLLAEKLLRENLTTLEPESQMLWVHGLLGTCTDPSNFFGRDVLKSLEKVNRPEWNNYFQYLVLCSAQSTRMDSRYVVNLASRVLDEQGSSPIITESQALALLVLKCIKSQNPTIRHVHGIVEKGLQKLASSQGEDGGFGFLYTTALVLQAFLAHVEEENNEAYRESIKRAMDNLKGQQDPNGSFRDLLGTYFVLPALVGRSLADLTNVTCNLTVHKEAVSPPHKERRISLSVEHEDISLTINLKVPRNSSILEILKSAASKHSTFTYEVVGNGGGTYVYSICGKTNDPEKGWFWSSYLSTRLHPHTKQEQLVSHLEDIATYVPSYSFHTVVFRYRKR